jgi:acetyl esterase/lipase
MRSAAAIGALLAIGCGPPRPSMPAERLAPRGAVTAHGEASQSRGAATVSPPCAFDREPYFLWHGAAPGGTTQATEKFDERSTNPSEKDRAVTGVSRPALFPHLPRSGNGIAAIVLPGGGYRHLSWDKEGVDIASWLSSLGVSAFVLKYRLPVDFPGSPEVALLDAQRALRSVRSLAAPCGIATDRIGVVGFSAGGHLASQLATRFAAEATPPNDAIDTVDARPSFAVLMYPVISMDQRIAHAGSRAALLGAHPRAEDVALHSSELHVSRRSPPTFIGVSLLDAAVDPENSLRFAHALAARSVPYALYRYADGGHGTGIRKASGDMAEWPTQCASWLTATFASRAP